MSSTLSAQRQLQFHQLYRVNPDTGCWMWIGRLDKDGYPVFRPTPKDPEQRGYRVSYALRHGDIPEGMQLDHTCHTKAVARGQCVGGICLHRRCVNPDHLEPVTGSENTFRSDHAERKVTHCPQGHEYTPENTIVRGGKRYCRTCKNTRWK